MRNEGFLVPLLLGLLALVPLGCSRSPDPPREEGTPAAAVPQTFVYTDPAGSKSYTQRVIQKSGAETLHGETMIDTHDVHALVVEDATLDERGALLRAEIVVSSGPGTIPQQRAILDRAQGTVRLEAEGKTVEFRVPSDAPWAYLPLPDAKWHAVSTPVAGWIAWRASKAPWVRVIRPGDRASDRVPSDQLAFATEAGKTAVLGCDSVDAGEGFVERVRLHGLGVTLTRVRAEEQPGTGKLAARGGGPS